MSDIMMLEGLSGNAGEAVADFFTVVGKGTASRMVNDPRTRAWLRQRGYELAKTAIKKITQQATKPPSAVERALEPLLEPVGQGIADAVKEFLIPLLVKASLIVAAGGIGLGWVIGKAHQNRGE